MSSHAGRKVELFGAVAVSEPRRHSLNFKRYLQAVREGVGGCGYTADRAAAHLCFDVAATVLSMLQFSRKAILPLGIPQAVSRVVPDADDVIEE